MAFWGIVLLAFAALVIFRILPTDSARWHKAIRAEQNEDRPNSAVRIVAGDGPANFARLDEALQNLPRTTLLAGSRDEGRLTYLSRSAVFGFPDFTTLELQGDTVKLLARSRFGKSDLGVNRARLEGIIAQIQP